MLLANHPLLITVKKLSFEDMIKYSLTYKNYKIVTTCLRKQ